MAVVADSNALHFDSPGSVGLDDHHSRTAAPDRAGDHSVPYLMYKLKDGNEAVESNVSLHDLIPAGTTKNGAKAVFLAAAESLFGLQTDSTHDPSEVSLLADDEVVA